MLLSELRIDDFRNIKQAQLKLSPGLNFIFGENGSGKTSLLEAISVLSTARSFRTRKFKNLISFNHERLVLYGSLSKDGTDYPLGLVRSSSGDFDIKFNGSRVASSSELAKLFPTQVINSKSFELLEGGAQERRQFFDWLVFHVKHEFKQAWAEYSRSLKQRNALLKHDKIKLSELKVWDEKLDSLATQIAEYRSVCIDPFIANLKLKLSEFSFLNESEVSLIYQQGWAEGVKLKEALADKLQVDSNMGYTSVGPHRSDLKFKINGKSLAEVLSRGQQKTFVSCLYMSAIELLNNFGSANSHACLLLIDDLPAELDKNNRDLIAGWITKLDLQCFITGVELDELWSSWDKNTKQKSKVFHVKHGAVEEITREWSE